jgi:hypothetical protein
LDVHLRVDTREVKDSLEALRKEGPKAIADALNRTAFEVLDAEAIEVRGAFPFMAPSAARFLTRSFVFDKATPERLVITVKPKPGAPEFLAEHAFGDVIPADRDRLTFNGKLAVPINVKRGASGRVPKNQTPAAILRSGKGFATPRAILKRTGNRSNRKDGRLRGTTLMYLLLERPVRLKKSLHFFEVFAKTVRAQFPKKADRVLEKINLRRQGR